MKKSKRKSVNHKNSSSKTKPQKKSIEEKPIKKSSTESRKTDEKGPKRSSIKQNEISKNESNEMKYNKKVDANNKEKTESKRRFFFCCCCGGNEEEKLNELLIEEEKLKEEERIRKENEEKIKEEKRLEEEKRESLRLLEEEKRESLRLLEEEREKEKLRLLEEKKKSLLAEDDEKEKKKDTVLKKKEIKQKPLLKKKAKLNFIGAASAPNPPSESACVGLPPEVKDTSVPVQEGVYLVYNHENEGQLELHYSKTGKKGSGVLAYIHSKTIPDFYFEKNKGKEIIFKEVSKKMQSTYVRDLKPYYECYVEFVKMKKKFNGTLYFLPAFDTEPPPKLDIIFFDSKIKKLNYIPLEKPVEITGDYLLVIQSGLEIFKKDINVESILSYLTSYGSVLSLS